MLRSVDIFFPFLSPNYIPPFFTGFFSLYIFYLYGFSYGEQAVPSYLRLFFLLSFGLFGFLTSKRCIVSHMVFLGILVRGLVGWLGIYMYCIIRYSFFLLLKKIDNEKMRLMK